MGRTHGRVNTVGEFDIRCSQGDKTGGYQSGGRQSTQALGTPCEQVHAGLHVVRIMASPEGLRPQ